MPVSKFTSLPMPSTATYCMRCGKRTSVLCCGDEPELDCSPEEPCYDCGSTISGHHTPLCETSPDDVVRDLEQVPGTQWWVEGSNVQKSKRIAEEKRDTRLDRDYDSR